MSEADPPEVQPAVVTAWCLLGAAGLIALLGAPAGVSIVLGLFAGGVFVAHRMTPDPDAPEAEPLSQRLLWARPPAVAVKPEVIVEGPVLEDRDLSESVQEVGRLSDVELCRAWRLSYVRLRHAQRVGHPFDRTLTLATQRRRYLDEMERRNPRGFAAWIAAGARAPGDPSRYLSPPVPRQRRPSED